MKRYWWLIALGLGALLAFALATLPASLLAGRLAGFGVQGTAFDGTIWSGRASNLDWRGIPLGNLAWRLSPAALLRSRIDGHARLERADGALESDFSVTFAGTARLTGTSFAFPIGTLSSLPIGLPKGWQGRAVGKFEEIEIAGGWPRKLRGTFDMDGLVAPPPRGANVGSFHIVAPHPRPQGTGTLPDQLTAQVTDKDGPFAVDAQLSVGKDRSFLLEGTIVPRAEVPEAMRRSLELLGPPDAQGRRPFSVSGTL